MYWIFSIAIGMTRLPLLSTSGVLRFFTVGDTIEGVDLTIGELGTLSDGLLEIFIPSEGDAMELSGEELAPISQ